MSIYTHGTIKLGLFIPSYHLFIFIFNFFIAYGISKFGKYFQNHVKT